MRVFVTGGTGFVGRPVVRQLLEAGDEVAVLTRRPKRASGGSGNGPALIEGDLLDPESYREALARFRPEAALHLAWDVTPGEYRDAAINDRYRAASVALVDALAAAGTRHVVMVGTCAEYAASDEPLSVDAPTAPLSAYAAAKLATANEASEHAAAAGLSFSWARLFFLYGPGQDPQFMLPSLLRTLNAGEAFQAARGDAERDYLHVEDAARALMMLTQGNETGIFNVCSGVSPTVHDLMSLAVQIVGRGSVNFGARPDRAGDPPFVRGDCSRLESLGWSSRIGLEEGIRDLVDAGPQSG